VFSDRLGQALFVNNTYFKYLNNPPFISKNENFVAEFSFKFPILPVGDYMISPAIADGEQDNHTQLHWLHDALHLQVHSSSVKMGLIGIPMEEIVLEIKK
jgi:lipopolysaccharide transport system ATP-binding protein